MIAEIYVLLYDWVSSIFAGDTPIKIWQYIYGVEVVTTKEDLVIYISQFLTLVVAVLCILFILGMFKFVFRLIFAVIKW